MARKKLNKKVALVGSVVFVLLAMAAILMFLRFGGDPQEFIKDGDAARKAAREAVDEQIRDQEYKKAEASYLRARARAKDDSLRIDILFKLADFFLELDKWNNARGCWDEIIRIDPGNVKALYARLKFIYIMADSGVLGAWKEVEQQASEFIKVAEKADLLDEGTAQWESFEIQQARQIGQQMGPYLYLLRGRAALEIAKSGALTDPEEALVRAVDDLKKVQEWEPDNVDAYLYLAQATAVRGDIFASRGDFEERDKTLEHAKRLLEQAVEVADTNPQAHINLLIMKLQLVQSRDVATAQERIRSFESECLSLVERFDSSAEAFSVLARFYQHPLLSHKSIDEAIEAIEKAIALDKENVTYAIAAANLYYRRFSVYAQNPDLYKAMEVAQNALTLPGAQDEPGPRQWADKRNRIFLYNFLANCYIEQILEPCEVRTQPQTQQWLTKAEQAVHEVEQLIGSGEDLTVVKWRGMLELARGNKSDAVKKLYATYEQIRASGRDDAQLANVLTKIFKDTSEVGAAEQFLRSALRAGIDWTRPELRLDYVELILGLNDPTSALANIDYFEERFGANQRSRLFRISSYITANQLDEAEEELANADPDDPNTLKLNIVLTQARIRQFRRAIRLKQEEVLGIIPTVSDEEKTADQLQDTEELMTAQLKNYRIISNELVGKLLKIEPDLVEETFVIDIYTNYVAEKKIEQAKNLLDEFLQYHPDNLSVLFHKQILFEPEPGNVSQKRRQEIEEQILLNTTDSIRRTANLGVFYYKNNEPNEAIEQFKKVLQSCLDADGKFVLAEVKDEETADLPRLAVAYLFDIAVGAKNWELAERMTQLARRENMDECDGQFFAARLAKAKREYKDAMVKIEECLKQRPVFSQAYRLRSSVNTALGNDRQALADARKAASLNPMNEGIAKVLAFALCRRDQKLGDNVSSDQIAETRAALINAQVLNPDELQLVSFYAGYIERENPDEALAILQRLLRVAPSMENALLLGDMAIRRALTQTNQQKKEAFFAIVASAFEQARVMNPQNRIMLQRYCEYYRITGQEEKAKELLQQSEDQQLLWLHYLQVGQFADAKVILEQLHQSEPNNTGAVKGLILIAERTDDKAAVKKYFEELFLIEDTVENHLLQIQTFLKIGLVKEAEYRLQSLKEKYPDEFRALLLEAWLTMRQGQLERALELTNRSLQTNQNNYVAWQLRGEINRFMANYDQAIIDLKKSKSLVDNPVTRIALAKVYLRTGQEENAITELKDTIDHPQAPEEGRMLLENVYKRLGRRQELKEFYDETLKKFADSVYWNNKAAAIAMIERDFSKAERLYKLAWQRSKSNVDDAAETLNGYLQALIFGGKWDKVFEEAQKYIESEFAPVAFIGMAEVKLRLGDKATAIQYCRKAVDKAETSDDLASWALQRMYSLLGFEEAMSYCKEKLTAAPDSLAANFTMYSLVRVNGQYNQAIGYIDKCLEIAGPDSPRSADYMVKKAAVLQLLYSKTSDKNYLKSAIATYESLLVKMPNNTGILNNVAYMLAENDEKLPEALEYARRAYQINPNDPGILDTYAYALYKNGKYPEAEEFLHSALQQFEQHNAFVLPDVYEHLGMVKEKLGASEEAIEAYKSALEAGAGRLPEPILERIKMAIKRVSSQ